MKISWKCARRRRFVVTISSNLIIYCRLLMLGTIHSHPISACEHLVFNSSNAQVTIGFVKPFWINVNYWLFTNPFKYWMHIYHLCKSFGIFFLLNGLVQQKHWTSIKRLPSRIHWSDGRRNTSKTMKYQFVFLTIIHEPRSLRERWKLRTMILLTTFFSSSLEISKMKRNTDIINVFEWYITNLKSLLTKEKEKKVPFCS